MTTIENSGQIKQLWLNAIKESGCEIINAKPKSPTFKHGLWTIAVEHQPPHYYKSLILKWRGPTNERTILPETKFQEVSKSDKGKGWFYRCKSNPSELPGILAILDVSSPTSEQADKISVVVTKKQYLTKADIDLAAKDVALGIHGNIVALLDRAEENAQIAGKILEDKWREQAEEDIKEWFK